MAFLVAEMPMIAFACLIVEPQNALAVYDVREPVLENVIRSGKGFRYSPENQLGERAFRVNNSSTEKLYRLHVGDYANTWPCCQWLQHEREVSLEPSEYVCCELPCSREHGRLNRLAESTST